MGEVFTRHWTVQRLHRTGMDWTCAVGVIGGTLEEPKYEVEVRL